MAEPSALDTKTIQGFGIAKTYAKNTDDINSLDYSNDGEFLVTAANDDSMCLYSCEDATHIKTVKCKRFGVSLARFTHHSKAVICASRRRATEESVRYLSLHDNRYLRFFGGHTEEVVQLSMCPVDDTFMSGASDRTVRFWDLRDAKATAIFETKDTPVLSYDPQGLIIAICTARNHLKLFDRRTLTKGPFSTFSVERNVWTHMTFTPDGNYILMRNSEGYLNLYDSFKGNLKRQFRSGMRPKRNFSGNRLLSTEFCPSISPDGKYLLCGNHHHR
ncbi:hypothetical protein AAMO2058_001597800 [Amorphochlora amoebiformis]